MDSSRTTSRVWENSLHQDLVGITLAAETANDLGPWRWDLSHGTVELAEPLARLIRGSDRPLTLDRFLELLHVGDRERVWTELKQAVIQRRPFAWEARFTGTEGGEVTVVCQGDPVPTATSLELVGVCRDVSSRLHAATTISQLERRLAHIIAESPAMISIKGLDHRYRMVNSQVARLAGVDEESVIGRTASEVFPTIGAQIDAQAADALKTCQAVHSDVQIVVDGAPRTFNLISFALRDHSGEPTEICCIASDVTDARRQEEESRLRREAGDLISAALREGRMLAARQPVTDISGRHTVSEELLVRMRLPDIAGAGILEPSGFLPAAERFNLIQQVDIWMVLRALELVGDRTIQVNLSALTFSDREARTTIVAALESMPEAAQRLVFEITETAAAHHLDAAAEFATALTGLGCGLALDDFGTGFGSFTYLRRLPLRYLKIDRSFVLGLSGSSHDRKVVSSIIGIAKQFELWTIAEGVEDAETLSILEDLGADFAQGYHLGRPAL